MTTKDNPFRFFVALIIGIMTMVSCQQQEAPSSQVATQPTPLATELPIEETISVATSLPTHTETPPPPSPTAANTQTPTEVPTEIPRIVSNLVAGTNQISIEQEIDGVTVSRDVFIQMPKSIDDTRAYPIVFAFHGAGGQGSLFLTNQHLNQFIEAGEFIGVYPNGHSNGDATGGFWNLGTEPTTADDIEFVNLIIEQLSMYREFDISRIYGIGISNGAGIINLLGKSTAHFNAIAPLFSQQLVSTGKLTAPAALSVFQLNGDADRLIPLDGGASQVGEFMSALDSTVEWAEQFNCAASPVEENLNWGNASITSVTYSNCASNHEIKSLIALDVGHEGFRNNEANQLLYTNIWAFFQQH